MAMSSSESTFQIEMRAKSRAFNLRIRLKGSLWGSPAGKAHRVSGTILARCRTVILRFSFTLLQAFGVSGQPPQQQQEIRYSLRIRLRKLWLGIRGKHQQESSVGVKPTDGPKPKRTKSWKRSLSSVGRQLFQRTRSSENITMQVSEQKPVEKNGHVTQRMGALGSNNVIKVLHAVGMLSTLVVLVQLAGSAGLPLLVTFVTGLAIVGRLIFVNRYAFLRPELQQLWHEVISVGGISLVPQVLRTVFRPHLTQFRITASEGIVGTFTLMLILLARYGRLPFMVMRPFGVVSAGIAAILVIWASIVQSWTCCWSPVNVNFMQVLTGLVAVLSNSLAPYLQSSLHQPQNPQSLRNQSQL